MSRNLCALCLVVCAVVVRPHGQAPDQKPPAFEVASIKQSLGGPNTGVRFLPSPGGRLSIANIPLQFLITIAYRIQESQLVGGPDWITAARYDISAKAEGNPTNAQLFPMLQALLAERFQLVTHHDQREMAVYALTFARSGGRRGPALKDADVNCETNSNGCEYGERAGSIHARGMQLTQLATALSSYAGRVVVDRTGIATPQDFDLTWTPERIPTTPPPPGVAPVDPNGPSLFTAIQEQLGLKLEPGKGPVDVLVIDHIEKPTPD